MPKGLAIGFKGFGKGKGDDDNLKACFPERYLVDPYAAPTRSYGKGAAKGAAKTMAAEDTDVTDGNEDYNTIKFDGIDSEEERRKEAKRWEKNRKESKAFLQAMRQLETMGPGRAYIPESPAPPPKLKRSPTKKARKADDDWGKLLYETVFGAEEPKEAKRKSSVGKPMRVKSAPRVSRPTQDHIDPMTKSRMRPSRSAPRILKNSEASIEEHSYVAPAPRVALYGQQGKGKGKGKGYLPAGQLRVQAHAKELPFSTKPSMNKINDVSTMGFSKVPSSGDLIRQPTKFADIDDLDVYRADNESSKPDQHLNVNYGRAASPRKTRTASNGSEASQRKTRSPRKSERIKMEDDDNDWNCEVDDEDDWGNYLYSSVVAVVYGQKASKKVAARNQRRERESPRVEAVSKKLADPWGTSSSEGEAEEVEPRKSSPVKTRYEPAPQIRVQLHQPTAQGKGVGKGKASSPRPRLDTQSSKYYF